MPTDLHDRIRDVLEAAMQRRTAERTGFLRQTVTDSVVLREALALLPHYAAVTRRCSAGTTRDLTWLPRTTSLRRALASPDDDAEWEPPFTLAPYRAVEIVGRGGMGVVYRAVDRFGQSEVAIKVLRGRLSSPEDQRRFRQEEELLRQLRHPGIVRLLHGGTAQLRCPWESGPPCAPRPYFVMEYVHGRSLLAYAAEHGLDSVQRLALFLEICAAVEYAHHRGVIHRDLKPENILVDDAGQPKTLDFGIARLQTLGPSGGRREFAGTLAYASPEQWAGRNTALTPASDVYTLGLILHEFLTGRLPSRDAGRPSLDLSSVQLPGPARRGSTSADAFREALGETIGTALRATSGPQFACAGELGAQLAAVVAAYAPRHGWRGWLARLAAPFGAARRAETATHERLLGVVLRRRIGLALDRGADRRRPPPA